MSDKELERLAAEALGLARRMHANFDRLGEIVHGARIDGLQEPFARAYFGIDADDLDELDVRQVEALERWGAAWKNGRLDDLLPPLPIADEVEREIAEEGL